MAFSTLTDLEKIDGLIKSICSLFSSLVVHMRHAVSDIYCYMLYVREKCGMLDGKKLIKSSECVRICQLDKP